MNSTSKLPRVPNRTTPGFAFSIVDRMLRECVTRRQFKKPDQQLVLDYFAQEGPICVFCGSSEVRRWDHLYPVKEGGDTVPGNMVLACAHCDDSKAHHNFAGWMQGARRVNEARPGLGSVQDRIERLRSYVQHFDYRPRATKDRLSPEELKELSEIESEVKALRARVVAFDERMSAERARHP